jgi:hypothetical protein
VCSPAEGKASCSSVAAPALPSLTLPSFAGSYFLLSKGDSPDASFELSVSEDLSSQPVLVFPGAHHDYSAVKAGPVTGGVQLSWQPTLVLMPGTRNPVPSSEVRYSAFFVRRKDASSYNLASRCGLDAAVADDAATEHVVFALDAMGKDPAAGSGQLSYVFDHLAARTDFAVVVVAECDALCLQQAAKVSGSSFCHHEGSCHAQSAVYSAVSFSSGVSPDGDGTTGGSDGSSGSGGGGTALAIFIGLLVTCALIGGMAALYLHWRRSKQDLALAGFDEMEMVDSVVFGKPNREADADELDGGSSGLRGGGGGSFLSSISSPFRSAPRELSMGERLSLRRQSPGSGIDWDELKDGAVRTLGMGLEAAHGLGSALFDRARAAVSSASSSSSSSASSTYLTPQRPSSHGLLNKTGESGDVAETISL